MTGRVPFLVRVAVALYRIVLRAYPREFRERCGGPMLETFRELCVHRLADGAAPFGRTCVGELASVIAGTWRSRAPRADRHARTLPWSGAWQDIRFAARRLRSQPAVVLLTTVTLGFAIAATSAMFTIVDATMLRPSPFGDPERLLLLSNYSPRTGMSYPGLSRDKLRQWREEKGIFSSVEAYRRSSIVVTGGVEPEEVPAAFLSPGLLPMLGLPPLDGRLFVEADGREGAAPLVLVSESYWRTRLGADAAAIGRTLIVNGVPHAIAGVMPARFQFPTAREQIWMPFDPAARRGDSSGITEIIVRLAPGLTLASARARVAAAVSRLEAERPLPTGWGIALHPSTVSGPDAATRRAVLILFGAVGLMLLAACANVANLLLSRAVDRQREFAIRLVLGAGRVRIFRELLAEGALLGVLATALGLIAARWALAVAGALVPDTLLGGAAPGIGIDLRVFTFTAAVGVLTGILCNLAPAFRALRARSHEAIGGRTKSGGETPMQRQLRAGLVIAEVALAVVLLVGAALMIRTFVRLNAVDIGFQTEGLFAASIGLDVQRYSTETQRTTFLQQVAHDVSQLPGVAGVAIAASVPPSPGTIGLAQLETDAGPCALDERIRVFANQVSGTFFPIMGIDMTAGRAFRDDDPATSIVLGRGLAALCGGTAVVGRKVRLDESAPWLEVLGIAADVKTSGLLGEDGERAFYVPLHGDLAAALPMTATTIERRVAARRLVVKADSRATVAEDVKRTVWARDPDQPVLRVAPLAELMGDSIRRERFVLTLMTLFSAVTLALASAGIFGVLAYTVAQRTNEIGIRVALGATAGDVLRLVVGHGLMLVGTGTILGLAGAFALSQLLAGLLYEVSARDPLAFATVAGLVVTLGLLAGWIPAHRALRVDPATALRVE